MCKKVTGSGSNYFDFHTPPRDYLKNKSAMLKDLLSGKKKEAVAFRCGCEIAPEGEGVKLVQRYPEGKDGVLVLKGKRDLLELLLGAHGLEYADDAWKDVPDFGHVTDAVDAKGVSEFLKVNHKAFSDYVQGEALRQARKRLGQSADRVVRVYEPDVGVPGSEDEWFGRFRFIPIQQQLAENWNLPVHPAALANPELPRSGHKVGLECAASSTMTALMSLGLVNPTLGSNALERKHTDLHAGSAPAADGAMIRKAEKLSNNTAEAFLRGNFSNGGKGPILGLAASDLAKFLPRFQGSDWAKLTGMDADSVTLEVVSLQGLPPASAYAKARESCDAGWPVNFYSASGEIYSNSAHWVTIVKIDRPPAPGAAGRFSYVENDHHQIDEDGATTTGVIESFGTHDFKTTGKSPEAAPYPSGTFYWTIRAKLKDRTGLWITPGYQGRVALVPGPST